MHLRFRLPSTAFALLFALGMVVPSEAAAQSVDAVCAYDVEEIGRRSALLSLLRVLPDAWQAAWHAADREHAPLPLHRPHPPR